MRTMLPLALTLATLVACGRTPNRAKETAVQPPARNLTLQEAVLPQAAVASMVELDRPTPAAIKAKVHRTARRAKPRTAAPPTAEVAVPVATRPTLEPAPRSIPTSYTVKTAVAADPHALEPGETVTVLPASSGTPSPAEPVDPVGNRPADARGTGVHVGTGGGSCGGRGGGRHPGGLRGLR